MAAPFVRVLVFVELKFTRCSLGAVVVYPIKPRKEKLMKSGKISGAKEVWSQEVAKASLGADSRKLKMRRLSPAVSAYDIFRFKSGLECGGRFG